MSNLIDTFAHRLKYAIKIRDVRPVDISKVTGISKTNLSCYMSGKYEAKQDGVEILAKVLDVNPVWLMGYDVPAEKPTEPTPEITDSLSSFNPIEYRSSSDVVKYLRQSKNMTRAEFATVLHCTEKTIKNIEEGHKLVSINLARKISNCFGLPAPNTLFSATLYDRYQKLNKRDSAIVDTLLEPLEPDEEEYVTIQTAARGGDEPGEKKISKSEAEKLLSATPQNDKYD